MVRCYGKGAKERIVPIGDYEVSQIVLPSNIVNLGAVETKVREAVVEEDELRYHKDNLQSLEKIKKEINMITGEVNA